MPRRTREETKRLLLDEGARVLLIDGLRGAPDIKLTDVCDQLERRHGIRITAGSVYERIWSDQRAFQLAVLAEVLGEYDTAEIANALDQALPSGRSKPRSGKARRDAKRDYCQRAATALVETTLASRPWQIWVGVWGAIASTAELQDDQLIGSVIEAGYERMTTAIGERVAADLDSLGYQPRPGLTTYQLGVSLGSLIEGLALRLRYDVDHTAELAINVHGALDGRGLLGLTFEAIVDLFHESP